MKRILTAAVAATLALASCAQAATLYWDADATAAGNNVDGTGLGGAGTWNTANANWWLDGAAADQAFATTDAAMFAGTAGRVQLGSNITAASLQFGTAGYVIDLCASNGGTAGYDLTVNGLSGDATITNSSTNTQKVFTVNLASGTSTTWGGSVGGRTNVVVGGGGTLTTTGAINVGGTYGTLTVKGGSRLNLQGSVNSAYVYVQQAGTVLDVGNTTYSARQFTLDAGATVTSSGTGRIKRTSQYDSFTLNGLLTGSLSLECASNPADDTKITYVNGANDYTGGTYLTGNNVSPRIKVTTNTGLGTGPVQMNNTGNGTSRLMFESAAPVIGSLSSVGANAHVWLGKSGVDTTLSVGGLNTNTTFGGVISQVASVGSIKKVGTGNWTLSGVNTYTGDTTVENGTLTLGSTGELRFVVQDGNVSNKVLGAGAAALNGLLRLDVSGLTDESGTWKLVDVDALAESFGGTFGLAFTDGTAFTNAGSGVYTSGDWQFKTATGELTLVPEPATMGLLVLGGVGALLRRRK